MLKKLLLAGILLAVCSQDMHAQEIFAPIKDALKTGNAKEVIKFLDVFLEMDLDGEANTYSKAQAEFVLRDFFKKNPASDFSIVHTGSSKGGLQFAIGRYQSNDQGFDVLIRVKEVQGVYLIHEMNFVKE